VYAIQDTLIELRVKIIDESTKNVPVKEKIVAPRNNVLHTIFEQVSMYINDTLITISPQNYAYKAYILNALTYPMTSKLTHLSTQGWIADSCGYFNGTSDDTNSGFVERNLLFREGFKRDADYRKDGAIFIGRLLHDLIACETGLPPGTKVKFLLTKNNAKFFIQTASNDTGKYNFQIVNACLYVPVAQLTLSAYNELSHVLSQKHEPRPGEDFLKKF